MIKNCQAVSLGLLIIAFLYIYTVFYEEAQEKETFKEYVEQYVEEAKSDIEWDKVARVVMIEGRLYYDTGKESPPRGCCILDGEITSMTDGSEMPAEDNQSNFGTDYGYCYVTDDAVELAIDKKWILFVCRGDE
ncbi:MAG: hypothetical protein K2N89_05935 [Lachnospiraceae bacterium]|nr:hypothetical protein [Lachnospiraceae bacterium]